ncbi:stage III sporulation protein AE [Bacillus sp. FJAT-50079]|uniref:stage III sporulation protein AE n=1 Tax=Bacillus sp. FJAT-50079 TaxID=2833577 RepID=UPI001BC982F2|nr:stage III sporulation protein AE [Bacillus sp. FJAT-50079]MBS4209636.1 stage III sporulation protein AE [Bacillus sp. FJAT-50079]
MPKRIILLVCFFLFFHVGNVQAIEGENSEDSSSSLLDKQLDQLGLEELTEHWEAIVSEYGSYLPESQRGTLLDFIKGDQAFSLNGLFRGMIAFAFQEIAINAKLLGSLMLLTIFSAFLQSLQTSFENGAVSKVAYSIIFIVLIIVALNSFRVAADYAIGAIDTMSQFILALIPLVLALIASSGGLASSAFFHPILLFLIHTSGIVIKNVVLPLLFLSTLLNITSSLSSQFKVTQLSGLLQKASIGVLGVFVTVLLGVLSVRGAAAAVADGVAIKTAKFVAGNFVPVVGRMFTDAADTVIAASLLLKNTVGIAGAAIVLLIAAFPAIKILVISFIYKLASALLQPLGNGPVIECLHQVSKTMLYIFAALAIVSFMFFLSLTLLIASSNITMMVR